jgi:hypothetical protein
LWWGSSAVGFADFAGDIAGILADIAAVSMSLLLLGDGWWRNGLKGLAAAWMRSLRVPVGMLAVFAGEVAGIAEIEYERVMGGVSIGVRFLSGDGGGELQWSCAATGWRLKPRPVASGQCLAVNWQSTGFAALSREVRPVPGTHLAGWDWASECR